MTVDMPGWCGANGTAACSREAVRELSREREKLYIFSSHLGLIRCLTPVRDSAIIYSQAFLDKHCNTTNIILPHKLNHGSCMLSKQPYMPVTNSLKPWAFKYKCQMRPLGPV